LQCFRLLTLRLTPELGLARFLHPFLTAGVAPYSSNGATFPLTRAPACGTMLQGPIQVLFSFGAIKLGPEFLNQEGSADSFCVLLGFCEAVALQGREMLLDSNERESFQARGHRGVPVQPRAAKSL
jgi:hypothetical protein